MRRVIAFLAAGILIVCSLAGCGNKENESAGAAGILVDTESVEYGTLKIYTDYIATLTPNLTVDVIPLVAGTVDTITVKTGDRVNAGDLLCQIDDTSADLALQSAEDAVNSAKAGRDAAELQTDTAQIQADANVKTLKKTLNTYEKSLNTAEKQLDKLKKSKNTIKKSQAAAKKTLVDSKKKYKTAQAIEIQFEKFLDDNPDCKTTAGLTAAATNVPVIDIGQSTVPSTTQAKPETGSNPSDSTNTPGSASPGDPQGAGTDPAGSTQAPTPVIPNTTPTPTTPATSNDSADDMADAMAKQKQAQALLSALTQAGLTVEYLSDSGLKALKEDASDSQTAYTGVNSGLTQIDSGIGTLKTNITQLKAQISATKDSLATARKLAKAAHAGTEVYDAQVEAALTGVDAAQYQKDLYRLTAPISGIVDAVNIKEKGMTAQGYAAFTIAEKDSMIATFYVPEDVKNYLTPGDMVTLSKNDDEETEEIGHVTTIGTVADPQKGLFKVEAEFVTTGQKELSGGTSVKLSLVSNSVNGELLIPYDAVYYDDGQAYVYRVVDGKATRTDVETGLFNQEYIVISSGLTAGDEIVTSWASGLKDGAEIEVSGNTTNTNQEDSTDKTEDTSN